MQQQQSARGPILRLVDLLAIVFMATLSCLAALAWLRGVPRGGVAVFNLVCGIALVFALRIAPIFAPNKLTSFLAANAPIGMVPIDWSLDPIVDLLRPALMDGKLLSADRLLFGETPSIVFDRHLGPWITEALLVGYLSYFTIIALPLIFLFFRGEDAHHGYARALVLLFVMNLSFYVLVPAIGPRFHVVESYAAPLRGVFFGDRIRDLFLRVPFLRDCFPSGHTAGTLLALIYTRRRLPVFFWIALPFGVLCIAATVLCRFHYAIDLLCALPLLWVAIKGAAALNPDFWAALPQRARAAAD